MSSGGMYTQKLDVDALDASTGSFDGTTAYARAKRAQVVLNAEWARRNPDLGVGFHALHPGWVDTPGLRSSLPGFARRLRRWLRTPEQGADTALWLAWTPDAPAPGGDFWHDRRRRHVVALPGTATPQEEADRLWSLLEQRAGTEDLADPRGGAA
jgi:dehydrogenase/reductase SDR family protein 12